MTWQPSPAWRPLTAGTGQATGGVWLTPDREVVKRLVRGVQDPRHHAYWERQALVAESGIVSSTPGLRSPACLGVERDPSGITLRMAYVPPAQWTPVALAAALGRFARSSIQERGTTLVAAYTGLSRAAWALIQPNPGDHVARLLTLSDVVNEAADHVS